MKKKKQQQDEKPRWHRVKPADQPSDPIFFRTVDIKIGTKLLYVGRLAPGAQYEVVRIMSDRGKGKGLRPVEQVEKLNDIVRFRLLEPQRFPWRDKEHTATFAALSYSAIWRLAK